jgi:hypothetical protein
VTHAHQHFGAEKVVIQALSADRLPGWFLARKKTAT